MVSIVISDESKDYPDFIDEASGSIAGRIAAKYAEPASFLHWEATQLHGWIYLVVNGLKHFTIVQ